jgi:hypothetical protein
MATSGPAFRAFIPAELAGSQIGCLTHRKRRSLVPLDWPFRRHKVHIGAVLTVIGAPLAAQFDWSAARTDLQSRW